MGGKSGGGKTSTESTSQVTLPAWLDQAAQEAVAFSQQAAARPYQAYGGQMVANAPADTLQAYQQIRDMQGMTDPAFAQAQQIYGGLTGGAQLLDPSQLAGWTNQLLGNYGQQVISPTASLLGQYLGQGPATAQQVGANALTLMQPYEQAVVNPALQIGQQALAQNLQSIGAGANQAGAFGGSRQGIMEGTAQAQAALQGAQYAGQLLSQGYNAALTPATQIALQGGVQGYNATTALANLLSGGYGTAAGQAADLLGTNLKTGLAATGALPTLATQQATEAQKEASLMQTIGSAQQNQQQSILNALTGQWYEQQQYPYQQLQTLLAGLGGVPYGSTTYTQGTGTQAQQKNVAAGVLGGAASGAAAGSVVPGIGNAIGAVLGGILGGLG